MNEAAATAGSGSAGSPTPDGNGPTGSAFAAGTGGPSLPPVTLPSGGGAIRGMGENFAISAALGTGTLTVPLEVSKSRLNAEPSLSLQYSTGSGNGPFGQGWSLTGCPDITRKTSLGLPKYRDAEDSDVFLISGAEDLVPVYRQEGNAESRFVRDRDGNYVVHESIQDGFVVRRYRPRTEGAFARIERWTDQLDPEDVHWRLISSTNETSIFGPDDSSRITTTDPFTGYKRIFSWLLAEWYDCRGNARLYDFKAEDGSGLSTDRASELNRTGEARSSQKYLKRIKYGNRTPVSGISSAAKLPGGDWMFEIVFDFGEHNVQDPKPQGDADIPWRERQDPFSSYISGFEVRTYRLCQRVLMFHHFPDELGRQDYLVSATELEYFEDPTITFLRSIRHAGYVLSDGKDSHPTEGPYVVKRLPPLQYEYTKLPTKERLQQMAVTDIDEDDDIDAFSMANVPSGGARLLSMVRSDGRGDHWYLRTARGRVVL